MNKRNQLRLLTLAAGLVPLSAMAHTGHEVSGFVQGMLHPLTGADHLLVMLAVGLLAAGRTRLTHNRAGMAIAGAFLLAMVGGTLLALAGVAVPLVEQGILVSVIAGGILLSLAVRLSLTTGIAVAAGFALFHGLAHGAELPLAASPFAYIAGFLISTSALLFVGTRLGQLADHYRMGMLTRLAGIGMAAFGVLAAL
ncbi:HupE/UreJ family protein [Amphritea sp. 2_MG-2023]|uniref:HupE/UreJ family protein n=1 Tax=Amphritea TaxID=515417 RepID=UPI001C06B503|nr:MULTISPECIES: HupE/UreJ family protein [Amphritea]MBU2966976.1 HupE/UreJ family protein [Amphritea atlantica]MDO6420342.1 HupE/UreJ family protein [Amphritea sp. 2_MG-2023]